MRKPFPETAYFFLIDGPMPEHIAKTFDLTPEGKFKFEIIGRKIIRDGENIPDNLDAAVIVYHTSSWHWERAAQLFDQLEFINPGIQLLGIPVVG